MDRVGADLPDAIQPLVIALKRAHLRNVANLEHRPHLAQFHRQFRIRVVDPHKPETAGADHFLAQPRQGDSLVTNRVIILGVLSPTRFSHRFGNRFAEPHPHVTQLRLVLRHRRNQLDIPVQSLSRNPAARPQALGTSRSTHMAVAVLSAPPAPHAAGEVTWRSSPPPGFPKRCGSAQRRKSKVVSVRVKPLPRPVPRP